MCLLPQPAAVADTQIPIPGGALAARLYRPTRRPTGTLMYFHGGGWVAGDLYTHDRLARTLAIELEAVVVSVDYRRPPEAAFPCAFDDCFAATRWAASSIATLGGDAARLGVGATAPGKFGGGRGPGVPGPGTPARGPALDLPCNRP